MKQVFRDVCNYAADLAGINSALYELGGLLIMHDASGCNSTYATHDEPRWTKIPSLIYISALEEYDAILGNDDKLINNVIEVAQETHPNFICVFGSPIALVMGTDFKGIAHVIEQETGIPTFGFKTSGMYSYIQGASQAYEMLAKHFVQEQPKPNSSSIRINLLGMTPLDLGYSGNKEAIDSWAHDHDFSIVANWSMGTSLEQIQQSALADVNVVVSSCALAAANVLKERFGIPYVVGVPVGQCAQLLAENIILSAHDQQDRELYKAGPNASHIVLIGEPVMAQSMRLALKDEVQIICPTEIGWQLQPGDLHSQEEEEIRNKLNAADMVIADPIYRRLMNKDIPFIDCPHWACSGRLFKDQMPVLIGDGFETMIRPLCR